MPSSSTHDTDKELRLISTFVLAYIRLYRLNLNHPYSSVIAVFATVLEMSEHELYQELHEDESKRMIRTETEKIRRAHPVDVVQSTADIVDDAARELAGQFGEKQQEMLYALARDLAWVANSMRDRDTRVHWMNVVL